MELSTKQLNQLEEQGFLVVPDCYSAEEVDGFKNRLPALLGDGHPANIVEKSSGQVRTSMGLHLRDEVFARLVRDARLVLPAEQILQEPFYIQQVKVNVKASFNGEPWQWHYDFATHHREDGVLAPKALNIHIFLDEVNEFNGPLYFIPGSHRRQLEQAWLDTESTSYPLWVVDNDVVTELVNENGIFSAKGPPGTVLIFHDSLVHASSGNISPWERAIFSLIVNPVGNFPRSPTRPDYKHHLSFVPVSALP